MNILKSILIKRKIIKKRNKKIINSLIKIKFEAPNGNMQLEVLKEKFPELKEGDIIEGTNYLFQVLYSYLHLISKKEIKETFYKISTNTLENFRTDWTIKNEYVKESFNKKRYSKRA